MIPNYQAFMFPLLNQIKNGKTHSLQDARSCHLDLTKFILIDSVEEACLANFPGLFSNRRQVG